MSNAHHHITTKIAADPRLANVPRPILDTVTELALTELIDGLEQAGLDLGEYACTLDDLRVCEGCEAISGAVRDCGEVLLCHKCCEDAMRCAKSPTGKHEYNAADVERARHLFDGEEPRCVHCQPMPTTEADQETER